MHASIVKWGGGGDLPTMVVNYCIATNFLVGICIIGSVATRIVRFGDLGIIFHSVIVVYPN